MKSLRLLVLTAFLSSPAWAVVSVVQNNVQVPTTGSLTPFDFLNDGTNSWPLIDIFDGTTHGTFNADGGFATHLNNTSVAVTGTFWQTTQPVSAASLPLPTGAATSALQTTINTTLGSPMQNSGGTVTVTQATGSNLHVNVDNTNANGSALSANSAPVVIASDQAAVATKAASGAFVAGSIADLAHGQGTMAASVPVAIASNQSAVPVSGTFWQTTQPVSGTVTANAGTGTFTVGQATAANLNATVVGTGTFAVQSTPATQYPSGSAAVQGSATGTTAATSTTLAATVSVTNYVCSISIRANATAAATGNATLSDGTKTFNFTQWTAPNASGVGVVEEIFNPCYPAAAANTAWTLTSAAPGTGGVVSVAIAGYQK